MVLQLNRQLLFCIKITFNRLFTLCVWISLDVCIVMTICTFKMCFPVFCLPLSSPLSVRLCICIDAAVLNNTSANIWGRWQVWNFTNRNVIKTFLAKHKYCEMDMGTGHFNEVIIFFFFSVTTCKIVTIDQILSFILFYFIFGRIRVNES